MCVKTPGDFTLPAVAKQMASESEGAGPGDGSRKVKGRGQDDSDEERRKERGVGGVRRVAPDSQGAGHLNDAEEKGRGYK